MVSKFHFNIVTVTTILQIICFRVRVWSWLFINLLLLNQNEANIMCICTHIKV